MRAGCYSRAAFYSKTRFSWAAAQFWDDEKHIRICNRTEGCFFLLTARKRREMFYVSFTSCNNLLIFANAATRILTNLMKDVSKGGFLNGSVILVKGSKALGGVTVPHIQATMEAQNQYMPCSCTDLNPEISPHNMIIAN